MTGLPASLLGLSLLFSFQGLTSPLPLGGARPAIDLSETHKDPLSEWAKDVFPLCRKATLSVPPRLSIRFRSLTERLYHSGPKGQASSRNFLLQYGSFYRLWGPYLSVGGVPRFCRIAWFCEHRSRGSRHRPREILAQGACTSSARKDLGASMRGDEPDVATLADLKNFAR